MTVLRQWMLDDMRIRNLTSETQTSYLRPVDLEGGHDDGVVPPRLATFASSYRRTPASVL